MKLFFKSKDGGPESNVTGYWLIESKSLFSVALLKFSKGSRDAFHTHAFNSVSWVLSGWLFEELLHTYVGKYLEPSILPVYTSRNRMHRVHGLLKTSWILTFRGPWSKTWQEYKDNISFTTLINGRKIVTE